MIDLKKIFDETYSLYPEYINISDGLLDERDGFYSKRLSTVHENAEIVSEQFGEWHSLFVWIFYKIIHAESKSCFERHMMNVKVKIDKEIFKFLLIQNLKEDGYEDMLVYYYTQNF